MAKAPPAADRSDERLRVRESGLAPMAKCEAMMKQDGDLPVAFGGRFLSELRRLTDSTWGFTYRQVREIELADEVTLLRLLRERAPEFLKAALKGTRDLEPESLARALLEESKRRTGADGPNPFDLLVDLIFLFHS